VILIDPQGRPGSTGIGGRATLDDLFRRAAERRPHAAALADPPNRNSVADGPVRHLTYAEADRMVSAIAGRLHRIGLHTDSIVALQLANTVESVLALLGVVRAGMIAMPLPLLWRRADATAALGRVGASALIVSGRIGSANHFDLAQQIAADAFSIRYVCGFGHNAPDGVIPFDDLYTAETLDPVPPADEARMSPPVPGAHLAVITWDAAPDGLIPVGRSHDELIAGGLAALLESRLPQNATVLTTLTLSSFAGLATGVLPWLLGKGMLALHHPFDQAALGSQLQSMPFDAAILPGPLVAPFAETGYLSPGTGLRRLLAVWRAPERLPRAPTWRDTGIVMTDIQVFGEIGLVPARRGPSGRPAAAPFGPVTVPRGANGGVIVAEARPTANGTVALRGPMVPRRAFPPGVERTSLPHLKIAANGFVDTGYTCWGDNENAPLVVTGPPPGVVAVGGYRFVMRDMQDMIAALDSTATLAALPDALSGHRLAGSSADRGAIQAALTERGANPLIADAFRDRAVAASREVDIKT
jgi:hypothetical protein